MNTPMNKPTSPQRAKHIRDAVMRELEARSFKMLPFCAAYHCGPNTVYRVAGDLLQHRYKTVIVRRKKTGRETGLRVPGLALDYFRIPRDADLLCSSPSPGQILITSAPPPPTKTNPFPTE